MQNVRSAENWWELVGIGGNWWELVGIGGQCPPYDWMELRAVREELPGLQWMQTFIQNTRYETPSGTD